MHACKCVGIYVRVHLKRKVFAWTRGREAANGVFGDKRIALKREADAG